MIRKLLMAGGDARMLALASLLQKEGYQVYTIGLLAGDGEKSRMEEAEAVLFPYPYSVRDGKIPALTCEGLDPQEVLKSLPEGILMIAQRGMEDCASCIRYTQAEGFEERNAAISAEAAVYEVMQRSDKALMDLCVLVTGYGLFARALARRLRALGAEVWIAARRESARRQAREDGMYAIPFEDMSEILSKADMVLNTVPAQIIGKSEMRVMRPDAWLIELASAPYGFRREEAQELGLKSALLPGLPSRYAPQSAAMALRDAVVTLIGEAEK